MALGTRNNLLSEESTAGIDTANYSPTAFTPTANTKLICFVFCHAGSNNGLAGTNITLSDSQGYFSGTAVQASTGPTAWGYGVAVFQGACGASPAATTLTVATPAIGSRKIRVYVLEWTGANATLGTSQVGASGTNTGAKSITLPSSPASSSDVVSALQYVQDNAAAITPGSGWAELFESSEAGWANVQVQGKTGSTSTTVDWTASGTGAYGSAMVAVEVQEAGGSSPVLAVSPAAQRNRRSRGRFM